MGEISFHVASNIEKWYSPLPTTFFIRVFTEEGGRTVHRKIHLIRNRAVMALENTFRAFS